MIDKNTTINAVSPLKRKKSLNNTFREVVKNNKVDLEKIF